MKYLSFTLSLLSIFLVNAQGSGNTVNFNGTDNAVLLGDQLATNVRSMEAWVKLDNAVDNTLATGYCILGRSGNSLLSTDQFHVGFESNAISPGNGGKISFSRRVGFNNFVIYSDQDNWAANQWIHVAVVIDAVDGMKMFINGVQQTETDASVQAVSAAPTAGDEATIGKWGNLDVRFFDGDIDEVRFWDVAQTENQIRENMCKKLTGTEPGLKAYYNFDNIAGTNVPDESTNTFDGTLENFGAAPSILSGAPLGNESTFLYSASLAGSNLNFASTAGDFFTVENIQTQTAFGVHIYKVNVLPNNTQGLNVPLNNYYGVFMTGTEGTYDMVYNFTDFGCSPCYSLNTRNDNASGAFSPLAAAPNNCEFNLQVESTVGDSYRAEYIIDQEPILLDLGNDTSVCDTPFTIGQNIPNATYLWQDGSQNPSFDVLQTGSYFVDVTIQACVLQDTINVTVDDLVVDLGADTSVCEANGNYLLSTGLNNSFNHVWQDGSTNSSFSVSTTGEYHVSVTKGACIGSDTVFVTTIEEMEVELGNTVITCQGENVSLSNLASVNNANYLWSTGATTGAINADTSGIYQLEGQNLCGVDNDAVEVIFENCDCNIYIPNTFTPDGDGANEVFQVVGDCRFMTYELSIYNRTGTLMFSSQDINDFWDGTYNGTLVPDGEYIYKLKYTTEKVFSEYIQGHINVLR